VVPLLQCVQSLRGGGYCEPAWVVASSAVCWRVKGPGCDLLQAQVRHQACRQRQGGAEEGRRQLDAGAQVKAQLSHACPYGSQAVSWCKCIQRRQYSVQLYTVIRAVLGQLQAQVLRSWNLDL
jgi:hypothetical protein